MLYALIAIVGITSFIAIKTYFPLFKFGASVMWIAVLAYLVMNYSGENWIVIAYLGCIVMVVAFPLSQLGRDIKRSQDQTGAFNISSESFHMKLPEWLKNSGSEEAVYRKREESNEEYRQKLHRALHPPRSDRRR